MVAESAPNRFVACFGPEKMSNGIEKLPTAVVLAHFENIFISKPDSECENLVQFPVILLVNGLSLFFSTDSVFQKVGSDLDRAIRAIKQKRTP